MRQGRRNQQGAGATDSATALDAAVARPRSTERAGSGLDPRRMIAAALPRLLLRKAQQLPLPPVRDGVCDVEYALSREELPPLLAALRRDQDPGSAPLESPARLEGALGTFVTRSGGRSLVTVRRSPATLMSPEYWHIRFRGLDSMAQQVVAELMRRDAA